MSSNAIAEAFISGFGRGNFTQRRRDSEGCRGRKRLDRMNRMNRMGRILPLPLPLPFFLPPASCL
ncbi:MAG: hypothetical protein V3T83_17190, partial [Acidobacteriota bacterium]